MISHLQTLIETLSIKLVHFNDCVQESLVFTI